MSLTKLILYKIIILIRRYKMEQEFYSRYNTFLPRGSVVKSISSIIIGENFSLGENCFIYCQDPENNSSLRIGSRVALNNGVTINSDFGGRIEIGNNVIIGPDVIIRAANHNYSDPEKYIRDQGHISGKIIIEDDVWLGARVVVVPDVRIGKGSVVGAGSVVTRDIPSYSVAVGVPAKVIKQRAS